MRSENKFRKELITELNITVGYRAYMMENTLVVGMPDIVLFTPGRALWIECKVGGNPINKYQKIWIKREIEAGEKILELRLKGSRLYLSRFMLDVGGVFLSPCIFLDWGGLSEASVDHLKIAIEKL